MTRKIRTAIAVFAAAVAVLSVAASAAPAGASVGPLNASLSITKQGNYSSVRVTGYVRATPDQTRDLLAKDRRIVWRLWGSDTFSDDLLLGYQPASVYASSRGLEFSGFALVRNSVLDEDWGTDEIYAGVRLVTSTSYYGGSIHPGATIVSGQSNEVWGDF